MTSLPAKLGVKDDARVLVTNTPGGFTLECPHDDSPDGEPYDVILLFCPELADLDRDWAAARARITIAGALWVAWPKRSSGLPTDLSDGVVRTYALDHGMVDVKVCAVDATWSALKMVRRKKDR